VEAILRTENICKYFGGLKAVQEVNIEVEKGIILGIIGPNGAGKTTLFNVLTGTYNSTKGKVYFKDRNITNLKPEKVTGLGIARTFQNIKLFKNMSVLDNVKIGFHTQTKTRMIDAIFRTATYKNDDRICEEVGMELIERVGLKDLKDEFASNLAYGNQRKLEIARALAVNPDILLVDEPTAGMNHTETLAVVKLLEKLNSEGLTVIIIEHDMSVIMNLCHNIVVLNHGQKISEGPPEMVRHDEKVIEAYLGREE